ncbi:MAG: hypothetical protein Q8K59_13155 [Nitrosomonas sp.]|nr:hypothetical protein [Nitrosomonas sp.]MDP1952006.1 hypothetical protein [Nitrosomonas sp.]
MKIRNLDLTRNPVNEEHQQLGIPPLEESVSHPGTHPFLNAAVWFAVIVLIVLILFLVGRFFLPKAGSIAGRLSAPQSTAESSGAPSPLVFSHKWSMAH